VGKSLSARYYAQWDEFEGLIPWSVRWDIAIKQEWKRCETGIYTPGVSSSASRVTKEVFVLRWSVEQIGQAIRKARGEEKKKGG
jgi:hypothetical protein